jgi:hypothetical protein
MQGVATVLVRDGIASLLRRDATRADAPRRRSPIRCNAWTSAIGSVEMRRPQRRHLTVPVLR